jgi:hypothetical protein
VTGIKIFDPVPARRLPAICMAGLFGGFYTGLNYQLQSKSSIINTFCSVRQKSLKRPKKAKKI